MHLITLFKVGETQPFFAMEKIMYIPRLRKKDNIMKIVKEIDPNTALSECLIDQLVKDNKITSIRYGNACLINLDELQGILIHQ